MLLVWKSPRSPPSFAKPPSKNPPQGPAKPPRPTQNRQGDAPKTTKTAPTTANLNAKPSDGPRSTPEGPKTSQVASEDPRFALKIDPTARPEATKNHQIAPDDTLSTKLCLKDESSDT